MEKVKSPQFQIPRYLGLLSVREEKRSKFRLQFGFSNRQRRELVVDREGLNMLAALTTASTASELSKSLRAPPAVVRSSLKALADGGFVTEKREVPRRLRRYDRHLLFYGLQGADALRAQTEISRSRIALIGMGGIGSWVSMNLIGAGFKELRLIDFDTIELSNLTRQILYTEKDLGRHKADVASERLKERNSQTEISTVHLQLSGTKQLKRALKGFDFVVLSADRPAKIHDWVDEVCVELQIPYLNVGYRDGVGVVGPMTDPGRTSCYQCHKPRVAKSDARSATLGEAQAGTVECGELISHFDSRYQAPSFGPLNAMVSSLAAVELIKLIAKIGEVRSYGVELEVDPMTFEIVETPYPRDETCWHCGNRAEEQSK